jgi:hypothetical protein
MHSYLNYQRDKEKRIYLFLNYRRNEDKPKYLFLNHRRNEEKLIHSSLNHQRDEQKRIYLFQNYRRKEDNPKYLFLNYQRNEDKAKYSFLNYRRNEDEAKYSFLNYRWFDIARADWWSFQKLRLGCTVRLLLSHCSRSNRGGHRYMQVGRLADADLIPDIWSKGLNIVIFQTTEGKNRDLYIDQFPSVTNPISRDEILLFQWKKYTLIFRNLLILLKISSMWFCFWAWETFLRRYGQLAQLATDDLPFPPLLHAPPPHPLLKLQKWAVTVGTAPDYVKK